jgi:hypothetical protein
VKSVRAPVLDVKPYPECVKGQLIVIDELKIPNRLRRALSFQREFECALSALLRQPLKLAIHLSVRFRTHVSARAHRG